MNQDSRMLIIATHTHKSMETVVDNTNCGRETTNKNVTKTKKP